MQGSFEDSDFAPFAALASHSLTACKPLESFWIYRFGRLLRNSRAGKALTSETDDQRTAPRPEKASERVRLAEALRENLRRRKAQTRARAVTAEAKVGSEPKPRA